MQTGQNLPDAFVSDLENVLKLIAFHPGIGARATNAKLENVRRVHLARVHYHLYYRVTLEPAIEVLALWHTAVMTVPQYSRVLIYAERETLQIARLVDELRTSRTLLPYSRGFG